MLPVLLIGDFTLDLVYEGDKFYASAGGSVFNVASVLCNHKADVRFVSRVGNDLPGKILLSQLKKLGIPQNTILQEDDFKTSLAFCEYNQNGKPNYSFYKEKKDFSFSDEMFGSIECGLLHIGSSFAFSQTSFPFVLKLCNIMKKRKIPITYDVNLRKKPTKIEKERIFLLMEKADIIKGSDEDFVFLYETSDRIFIMNRLLSDFACRLGIITYGKDGVFLFSRSDSCFVKQEKILENAKSIGAGDSFMAGIILFYQKDSSLTCLENLGRFANSIAVDFLSSNGCV